MENISTQFGGWYTGSAELSERHSHSEEKSLYPKVWAFFLFFLKKKALKFFQLGK